jgi:hypothetical protein
LKIFFDFHLNDMSPCLFWQKKWYRWGFFKILTGSGYSFTAGQSENFTYVQARWWSEDMAGLHLSLSHVMGYHMLLMFY